MAGREVEGAWVKVHVIGDLTPAACRLSRPPLLSGEMVHDERIAPKEKELAAIVDMVKDMLAQDVDIYLNVNNHYEGSAPLTIQRFEELMK